MLCTLSKWCVAALHGAELKHTLKAAATGIVHNRTLIVVRCCGRSVLNQSINQRNFYSATYKKWTAALDNVNI